MSIDLGGHKEIRTFDAFVSYEPFHVWQDISLLITLVAYFRISSGHWGN